jgi:glycosyltransferase involved in cell wall biosynthesis
MRILQVIADGSPGGGTTHTLQILSGLKNGYNFSLLTQQSSYLFAEATHLGIPTFGIEFFRSRLDPRVPIRISKIADDVRPDVIHAHGGRAAFFASLGRVRIPMVYTVHGYHFVAKNPFFRSLAIRAERRASRSAEHVVFVSSHDLRLAEKYGFLGTETKKSVIHCGIPFSKLPPATPSSLRHVGFIGRLEHPKDPLLMLDVFERLPEYRATMVGGGDLERSVQKRIKLRALKVEFLGLLPHERTLQVLSTLGVLVMTSRWEGLPILALEAMSVGVPVVATRVGGLPEIIEDGRSGMLVKTRSPDEIVAAVRTVTEDLELRDSIIRSARERVQTLFSEERMLSSIRRVYDEVSGLA